jgi:hypothetical protein
MDDNENKFGRRMGLEVLLFLLPILEGKEQIKDASNYPGTIYLIAEICVQGNLCLW